MRHATAICRVALLAASLLCSAVASAQTVPLREGLTLVTAVSRPAGAIETTLKVTAVTPRTVKLQFTGQKADGGVLSSRRTVRVQDLKSATSIRPNFVDGAEEFFENTTAFGTSSAVLTALRRGSSRLTLDVGGLSMGTGLAGGGLARELDGMLDGMGGFAGISQALEAAGASGAISAAEQAEGLDTMGEIGALQMAGGQLTAAGRLQLPVRVNGKIVQLPGLIARGRLSKGEESYDAELVFLDDPTNPLTLKSRVGSETTTLLRIDYPGAP